MRNKLPELRSQESWTQAELAQQVGVSRQTIVSIENGRFDPSLPLAFRLASIFRMRVEDIFEPE